MGKELGYLPKHEAEIICDGCSKKNKFKLTSDSVGKKYKDGFKATRGKQVITVECQCGRTSILYVTQANWGVANIKTR